MDVVAVDTIAAISTPPGAGAIAVVRLSGPQAMGVLAQVAPELGPAKPRRAQLTAIRDPGTGELVDRAVVVVNPGPGSYTGEDLVEISGHGGWLGPAMVLEACLAAGARIAGPGEFTRRAYLNGRMDLVQAEAVADLIEGRSSMLRRAALGQLDRGLSAQVSDLRTALVRLEALLVHHLDFPDEDDAPYPVAGIADEADRVAGRLRRLLETASEGELLREGALVVLAGQPNSGKSSLFNALLGRERAIVTEVPGTTRDALEATVSLGGFPFRLVDTAGLRDAVDRVEQMGVEVARGYLAAADLVLLCVEEGGQLVEAELEFLEEAGSCPVVVAWSKADLARGPCPETPAGAAGALSVSALTGIGLPDLRALLPALVYRGLVVASVDAPVLTRSRHAQAVRGALAEVEGFASALREGVGPEVASAHLRPAETALEELLGVITHYDVLDRVFSDFCIGK